MRGAAMLRLFLQPVHAHVHVQFVHVYRCTRLRSHARGGDVEVIPSTGKDEDEDEDGDEDEAEAEEEVVEVGVDNGSHYQARKETGEIVMD